MISFRLDGDVFKAKLPRRVSLRRLIFEAAHLFPGITLALRAHLDSGAEVTEASVRAALAGNLCRCTGYQHIVEAAVAAS